ncbi:hypothetical protein AncyloWKF20_08100 [Ancylobacter sp. WKF20]|uniref:hypothetical protein n=1 Tax=Ancylobacter sp. WKF20 TaxID=3039801 RepID=UPI0024342284|nr:hypothetical protein [Ancylobacter sp. WKF20]WGD32495.1 hypothetical protein AncyloWKF20_08100 [Ancylobacter sp. WKF20]
MALNGAGDMDGFAVTIGEINGPLHDAPQGSTRRAARAEDEFTGQDGNTRRNGAFLEAGMLIELRL